MSTPARTKPTGLAPIANDQVAASIRRPVVVSSLSSDAHTWNLVFLQLLVEELGFPVINLGPCVPPELLVAECVRIRPTVVVLSSVNGHGYHDGLCTIRALRDCRTLAETVVVLGGKLGTSQLHRGEHVGDLLAAGYDAVYDDETEGDHTADLRALVRSVAAVAS